MQRTDPALKKGTPEPVRREGPFSALRREFDHLFGGRALTGLGKDWGDFPDWRLPEWRFGERGELMPSVDVSETDTEVSVKAELPGMDEKDFQIWLDDGVLVISGEKKSESRRDDEGVRIAEVSYGKFERRIPIPVDIEEGKVRATYDKGVLSLTLPKTERARAARKRIAVSTA